MKDVKKQKTQLPQLKSFLKKPWLRRTSNQTSVPGDRLSNIRDAPMIAVSALRCLFFPHKHHLYQDFPELKERKNAEEIRLGESQELVMFHPWLHRGVDFFKGGMNVSAMVRYLSVPSGIMFLSWLILKGIDKI